MSASRRPTAADLMTGKARPGQPGAAAAKTKTEPARPAPAAPANPYLEADLRNRRDQPSKPVRVTLNIPAGLYRQLRKWTDSAADEIGVPQVSQQDALRAMITAATTDKDIGLVVIDLLRRDTPGALG